ncbi:DUF1801 domain-containing protein [Zooshikella ganghwensis]|uniref:DUF1801 domain-containing protein n=1 Tax=Zooshikella ganghwensis TaxID=202772 RepID=A0A4P9VJV6_9GAMM|nr:DUF1801 domain-containing protein [Zooshikella ganghwensis]RDH42082.1 DUF1801 domain-containing protein [Zooshikella ganghwensis]
MNTISSEQVSAKFNSYPPDIRQKLLYLRSLIFEAANELDASITIEESLKWGEPSYLVKGGSTIRIDWKEKNPDYCVVYFNCKTTLISTFKVLYRDIFHFEGNRAIMFNIKDSVPIAPLKHCISMALRYHRIKHLPMLGG